MNDLKFASRQLLKHPGFTAAAVLTLALCLGANLTIFAVIDSVLLRPLPFPEPDRLVAMFNSYPKMGRGRSDSSYPNYYNRRGHIAAFLHVAAFRDTTAIVGEAGSTELTDVTRVSPEFFATLGIHPALGRVFTEEEMTYQTDGAVILTDGYWRKNFNADPGVLGRTLRADGLSKAIVGVLPPDFRFLSSKARLFHPLSSDLNERDIQRLHSPSLNLIARLKPGATLAEARTQIDAHDALVAKDFPDAQIAFDGRLAIVALLGAGLIGVVIAVPIAWFNLRDHLANALQSETRGGTATHAAQRLRHGFVVTQIALAFVLLAGAGLLGLSLKRAMAVPPGFRADRVLTGRIALPWKNYPDKITRVAFADRLVEETGKLPGVLAAGVITDLPVNGSHDYDIMTVVSHTPERGAPPHMHHTYWVAGDYFSAMGIPLRAGRFLEGADSHRDIRNCVVDEDFARIYWPQGNAIGQRLFAGNPEGPDPSEAFMVVGVVGAVKQTELTDAKAGRAVYFPYGHQWPSRIFVVARTSLAPESLELIVQKTVRRIDPELPVYDLRSMQVRIADSLVARRSPALLSGIFAGVTLLLAAIGTYGVLSYAVAQRRREIGVRMALGAQPKQIGNQFLSLGLRLLAAGTILGIIGAWWAGRAMQIVLFDVPTLHVTTLVGTGVILTAVSLAACWLPARRAARVDPIEALRSE